MIIVKYLELTIHTKMTIEPLVKTDQSHISNDTSCYNNTKWRERHTATHIYSVCKTSSPLQ